MKFVMITSKCRIYRIYGIYIRGFDSRHLLTDKTAVNLKDL